MIYEQALRIGNGWMKIIGDTETPYNYYIGYFQFQQKHPNNHDKVQDRAFGQSDLETKVKALCQKVSPRDAARVDTFIRRAIEVEKTLLNCRDYEVKK